MTGYRFLLIIGAMKCGTTSLFHYLAQHPQIAPSSVKEPQFFAYDEEWRKGWDSYTKLWDWDPSIHRYALEASTNYTNCTKYPDVVDRIASIDGDVRFLYIVRNPIERIESDYNHGYNAGWYRRDGLSLDERIDKHKSLTDISRYAMQLDRYRERFGREKICVVNLSTLKQNPEREFLRILDFLELEQPQPPLRLEQVHNPGEGRISEHPIFFSLRSKMPLFRTLNRFVPKRAQLAVRRLLGRPAQSYIRLSAESRRKVVELLREDMQRLRDEYGVDISPWLQDPD